MITIEKEGRESVRIIGENLKNNIPDEIARIPRWGFWKRVKRGKKIGKIPVNPQSGRYMGWMEHRDLLTLDEAIGKSTSLQVSGINFLLHEDDPYTVIDIDGVTEDDYSQAKPLITSGCCYCERSIGGAGIHIFIKGKIPGKRHRKNNWEMYDRKRFMVCTGSPIKLPKDGQLKEAQSMLDELYIKTFGVETPKRKSYPLRTMPPFNLEERWEIARKDPKLLLLHSGSSEEYGEDVSRADFAYFVKLRYWFGEDEEIIKYIAFRSHRVREKWHKHPTYLNETIKKMLQMTRGQKIFQP